jgi:hypothetical protein
MPYDVKIECAECKKQVPVPQVGAMPPTWIMLRHAGPVKLDQNLTPQQTEPVTEVVCSWACALKYVRNHMEKQDLPVKSKRRVPKN